MCTLILSLQTTPDAPLLVAANRDERLDRPALPPRISGSGVAGVLAPVDLEGGGTWLGATGRGLVVGVTNRFGQARDPARRSRGLLVRDLLAAPDAETAAGRAAAEDPARYNPFHLVVADAETAFLVWHDGQELVRETLTAGVHVVIERSLGAAPSQREGYVRERATALARRPFELEAWHELLAHHTEPPFESVCVHLDSPSYGTRSSTVIRVDESGLRSFLFADGPPCAAGFVEHAGALLAEDEHGAKSGP
ncbi:MAG: NRDE family protein [Deltaproteobacteria bacterium]|nr:NRDE family protein [Deltaproteobacteria bacterium]